MNQRSRKLQLNKRNQRNLRPDQNSSNLRPNRNNLNPRKAQLAKANPVRQARIKLNRNQLQKPKSHPLNKRLNQKLLHKSPSRNLQ